MPKYTIWRPKKDGKFFIRLVKRGGSESEPLFSVAPLHWIMVNDKMQMFLCRTYNKKACPICQFLDRILTQQISPKTVKMVKAMSSKNFHMSWCFVKPPDSNDFFPKPLIVGFTSREARVIDDISSDLSDYGQIFHPTKGHPVIYIKQQNNMNNTISISLSPLPIPDNLVKMIDSLPNLNEVIADLGNYKDEDVISILKQKLSVSGEEKKEESIDVFRVDF